MMKLFLILIPFLFLTACTPAKKESDVKAMLEVILKDDMATILQGVSQDAVLDTPNYVITEWKAFDEGKQTFTYKAEVDFFFLKDINKKIVRKYRYSHRQQKWDRYFNEYQTIK